MDKILTDAILNGLSIILIGVISYLARYITVRLGKFIEDKEIGEEIKNKQYLANIVVNAIQQIYEEEDGPIKYRKAKEELVKLANKNGIGIDVDELEIFIEDAYKAMIEGVGDGVDDIHTKPLTKIVKKGE